MRMWERTEKSRERDREEKREERERTFLALGLLTSAFHNEKPEMKWHQILWFLSLSSLFLSLLFLSLFLFFFLSHTHSLSLSLSLSHVWRHIENLKKISTSLFLFWHDLHKFDISMLCRLVLGQGHSTSGIGTTLTSCQVTRKIAQRQPNKIAQGTLANFIGFFDKKIHH